MPLLQPQEMEKMKSKEYWQKRYMLIEGLNNTQGINIKADIDKAFRMAENGIQSEIEKWYSRIADNNGVSISKARRMLTNRELEEFKWDLADYIKHGEENNINGKWIKELENASGRWHINRLEALKLRVQQKAEEAFGNEVDSIDRFARDAYMRGYYRTAYEIQKGLGLGWNVGVLDDAAIDEIIKKPWCPDGKNFSSRIWTRKAQMVDELHRELLRTTLLGEHPTKAIDRMLKYVDNSFGNARHAAGRLAMTEAAYFGSKGQQDSFNMLGVEEYEIVATLDNSTSKICREMDGKHFPMSEYKAGVTAPPFHPYCRTCTCPYFDDKFTEKDIRSARNEEGEVYHVPAVMKYEEWKKKYVKAIASDKKTGIMESELGKFKEKVQDIQYVGKDYYKLLKNKFSHASDEAKTVFNKFIPSGSVAEYDYNNVAYYDKKTQKIHMSYKADMKNKGATYFHEHGHMVDDLAGGISKSEEFRTLIEKDANQYRINYGKQKRLGTYDKIDKAISLELNNMHRHSAVSDIFQGITRGNINGVAGHLYGYWDNEDNITAEAFAHMFEAEFDKTRYAELDKYFPNAHQWFKERLKEMAK